MPASPLMNVLLQSQLTRGLNKGLKISCLEVAIHRRANQSSPHRYMASSWRRAGAGGLFGNSVVQASVILTGQKPLCFQSGHTAHAGTGDGLPVFVVGQIARGKHTGN